jgi:hypothetical protein
MPLYEVELRGRRIEERLTDHPLEVGQSIQLGGGWIVAQAEAARDSARELRYICVRTHEEAEAVRAAARCA